MKMIFFFFYEIFWHSYFYLKQYERLWYHYKVYLQVSSLKKSVWINNATKIRISLQCLKFYEKTNENQWPSLSFLTQPKQNILGYFMPHNPISTIITMNKQNNLILEFR